MANFLIIRATSFIACAIAHQLLTHNHQIGLCGRTTLKTEKIARALNAGITWQILAVDGGLSDIKPKQKK